MSYTMKDIMSSIFIQIIDHSLEIDEYDVEYDIIAKPRWIKKNKDEDLDYLQFSKLNSSILKFRLDEKIFVLKYKEVVFCCIISDWKFERIPYYLTPEYDNHGLIASTIYHGGVTFKPDIPKNKIYNEIAYQYKGVDLYNGHEMSEVLDLLKPINIFKVGKNYPYKEIELERILGSLISHNLGHLRRNFDERIEDEYSNMLLFGPSSIPFSNLLNSLLAGSYEHTFLELYKCIESLYQVVYVIDLYRDVKPNCNLIEFLDSIENLLKWRPVEHKSINNIISNSPKAIKELFNSIGDRHISERKAAEWYYDLRNRIVHLKQIHKQADLLEEEWLDVIYITLRLIEYWFNKYENELKAASNTV